MTRDEADFVEVFTVALDAGDRQCQKLEWLTKQLTDGRPPDERVLAALHEMSAQDGQFIALARELLGKIKSARASSARAIH